MEVVGIRAGKDRLGSAYQKLWVINQTILMLFCQTESQ